MGQTYVNTSVNSGGVIAAPQLQTIPMSPLWIDFENDTFELLLTQQIQLITGAAPTLIVAEGAVFSNAGFNADSELVDCESGGALAMAAGAVGSTSFARQSGRR
jgi:hypothetical protein